MSNLLTDILNSIGQEDIKKIGDSLGIDKRKTDLLMKSGSAAILGGLAKNAQKEKKSKIILNILKNEHSDNLDQKELIIKKEIDKKGSKILEHTWGSKKNDLIKTISSSAGVNKKQATNFLEILAPLFMGGLSETVKKTNMDSKTLSGVLKMSANSDLKNNKSISGFLKILDLDKDGKVIDDLPKIWAGIMSVLTFLGFVKKK